MPVAKKYRIWISAFLLTGCIMSNGQSTRVGIDLSRWPLRVSALPEVYSLHLHSKKEIKARPAPLQLLLPETSPTAIFCRMELKAEKAIHFPFLFRLGSVDYVEKMEGKRKDFFIR